MKLGDIFEQVVKDHVAGNLPAAAKAYETLIDQGHRVGDCASNLSIIKFLSHDYEAAEALARKAVDINSEDANSWNNLGLVFKAKSQWPEASQAFAQAVKNEPKHSRAWSNLADVLDKLKETEKALGASARAVNEDPSGVLRLFNFCIVN